MFRSRRGSTATTTRPRSSCGATDCAIRSRARMRNACGTFGTTTTTGRPLEAPVRTPVRSGARGPCGWFDTPPADTATHPPRNDPMTARGIPSGGTCSRSHDADVATCPRNSSSAAPAWVPPPRCTPRATLWTTRSPVRIPSAPPPRSMDSSSSSTHVPTTPVAGGARRSSATPAAEHDAIKGVRRKIGPIFFEAPTRGRTPSRWAFDQTPFEHVARASAVSDLPPAEDMSSRAPSHPPTFALCWDCGERGASREQRGATGRTGASAEACAARSLEETREWPRVIREFVEVVNGREAGGGHPVVIRRRRRRKTATRWL